MSRHLYVTAVWMTMGFSDAEMIVTEDLLVRVHMVSTRKGSGVLLLIHNDVPCNHLKVQPDQHGYAVQNQSAPEGR